MAKMNIKTRTPATIKVIFGSSPPSLSGFGYRRRISYVQNPSSPEKFRVMESIVPFEGAINVTSMLVS
jgi:hypothetical protein